MLWRDAPQRPGAQHSTDSYLPVFILLLVIVGLATFVDESPLIRVVVGLGILVAVVATLRATGSEPQRLRLLVAGATVLGVGVVIGGVVDRTASTAVVMLLVAASLGYAAFSLVCRILEQTSIRINEVLAALTTYLQLALVFALTYSAAARVGDADFFTNGMPGELGDFVYFSVVTVTTLGYGDLTPATDLGRSLVMIETLLGQIILVVLVAFLVGMLAKPADRKR